MPRARQDIQQTYTFIKGLITEQSNLSSATDSFSDGTNVLVTTKGETKKRLGADYESGYELVGIDVDPRTVAVSLGLWSGVNGRPDLNLIVLQAGTKLYMFDASLTSPSSEVFLSADFGSLCRDVSAASSTRSQFANVNGSLIMTNAGCDPLHIEYSEEDDVPAVSFYKINLRVRDFIGISDGLRINEQPASLSAAHHYNLKNQGWTTSEDTEADADYTENGSNTTGGGGSATPPDIEQEPSNKL